MARNRTTILNDKAIETLKDDALDFAPYVQALAKICLKGDTPLTVGVFGSWGSGKTSLMRMIKGQVEASGAVAGWFDAWKYEKDDTLWRAFLLTVLLVIRKSIKDGQPTEDLDYLETMLYRAIDLEKAGGVTIDLAKLGGKLAQGAVQVGLSFIPSGAALGKIIDELQKKGTENISQNALDAIQRERSKIHVEQVRFLEQFQDKFCTLVQQHVVNNGGRLVIFIDDLDRCLPEKAIEVLEAIKLFVDVPGCIFVLGLDQEVIARGIELKYQQFDKKDNNDRLIDGSHYLEKIIQLPFYIPPMEQQNMGDFVKKLVKEWPDNECPEIFSLAISDNPRQVKRAINMFLLLYSLSEARKEIKPKIKPIHLAKLVVIQSLYPDLYVVLKSNPGLLPKLEDYYRTKNEIENGYLDPTTNVKLPPELVPYGGNLSLSSILTMHKAGDKITSFDKLSDDEMRIYFTLSFRPLVPYVDYETKIDTNIGTFLKVPVMGKIAANLPMPITATDFNYYDAETGIEIARSLLPAKRTNDLFALEVVGDDMADAMVNDGDIVIVRRTKNTDEARNGEMVAAWLPARCLATLRYFYRENGGFRLQPANLAMKPIYIDKSEELEIRGKVVMVIRKVSGPAS